MDSASAHPGRPRVLRVDLTRLAASAGGAGAGIVPFADPDGRLERIGIAGGSALCHVLFHRALDEAPARPGPLVIAVGAAVRAGLPTAARASLLSRSPLSGRLAEGQIGGPFARALASVADALFLHGQSGRAGAVLVVRAGGSVELLVEPELAGRSPRDVARHLMRRLGPCAALAIGAAGEAGIPFASIASLDDPPSFVGRGGLGAVFGALGLKAVAVVARSVEPDPARAASDRDLQRALLRSPRLRSRGEGGTLELASLEAARSGAAHALADAPAESTGRKGCEGCPTPCGLVFERGHPAGRTRHLGRFGALNALSDRLGLAAEEARELLARCDELALDAKEAGAVLALARGRGGSPLALLDDVVARRGLGATLALGSRAAARELGRDLVATGARALEHASPDLAVRLGAAVSARGSDPMRTFPFLALDASSRAALESALAAVPLPERAEDPRDPAGKGRIVWWHENLVNALDATGFCAFSAAGLVSDGIATLDELARWIAPSAIAEAERPARALLALGASLALLQRATLARLGVVEEPEPDPVLDHPALRPEYARWRGLGADGRPTAGALELIGDERLLELGLRSEVEPRTAPAVVRPHPPPDRVCNGRVTFGAGGALGRALDGQSALDRDLPACLEDCLRALAERAPAARPWLFQGTRLVPQAWRAGRRLEPSDWLHDGDHVELVVAIGGG